MPSDLSFASMLYSLLQEVLVDGLGVASATSRNRCRGGISVAEFGGLGGALMSSGSISDGVRCRCVPVFCNSQVHWHPKQASGMIVAA